MNGTLWSALAAGMLSIGASVPTHAAEPTTTAAKVQRLWDIQQIDELMSRHEWYYSAGEHQRELDELFAHDLPDVSFGTNIGYWVGMGSIKKFYVDWFKAQAEKDLSSLSRRHPEVKNVPENLLAGTAMMHTLTTPLVVVADDGRTAKGLWYTIGEVTQTPLGQPSANYMWERYAIDFIKEPEGWRIWHFNVFTDISTSPDSDWTHPQPNAKLVVQAGEVLPWMDPTAPQPDVPGQIYQGWAVTNVRGEKPRIPVPFRTFSETFSYGAPNSPAMSK